MEYLKYDCSFGSLSLCPALCQFIIVPIITDNSTGFFVIHIFLNYKTNSTVTSIMFYFFLFGGSTLLCMYRICCIHVQSDIFSTTKNINSSYCWYAVPYLLFTLKNNLFTQQHFVQFSLLKQNETPRMSKLQGLGKKFYKWDYLLYLPKLLISMRLCIHFIYTNETLSPCYKFRWDIFCMHETMSPCLALSQSPNLLVVITGGKVSYLA